MGNDRSPGSQHNVWRYMYEFMMFKGRYLWTWNSDQELIQKHKMLCQSWLSASIKKIWIKMVKVFFQMLKDS